jgi:uncharacterized protein YdhG (YjbR/CyaY superfamily)
MPDTGSRDVGAYIAAAPKKAQPLLRQLRAVIKEAAPKAEERISYKMPSYQFHGRLVYFAVFKDHIGLYPAGYAEKYAELRKYMSGKGTLRFPLDQPLPARLITKLIKQRVKENEAKS